MINKEKTMRSHLTFSLIAEGKIVITVLAAVLLLCGCRKEKQIVFTDTVYASESSGYSLTGTVGETDPAAAQTGGAPQSDLSQAQQSHQESADAEKMICVFVCGAVNCEGVYELRENSRVIDAVAAAGGYSEDADTSYVNQAEYVFDTQRIQIPTVEEATELREAAASGIVGTAGSGAGSSEEGRIDLNTADKQELMTIPGIGESKADSILAYRQTHGRFGSTEEIMNVSGIGSGVYEKLKDRITVK